jgi:hypothetical protein
VNLTIEVYLHKGEHQALITTSADEAKEFLKRYVDKAMSDGLVEALQRQREFANVVIFIGSDGRQTSIDEYITAMNT